jgi:hypothetical protein
VHSDDIVGRRRDEIRLQCLAQILLGELVKKTGRQGGKQSCRQVGSPSEINIFKCG